MSYFTEILPSKTKGTLKNREWKFMLYQESPFERKDQRDYCAFLFRDEDRTLFGMKEYFDDDILPIDKFRDLAAKVVRDSQLRKSLLSDNPDLPRLWKRH
jgi:hypothetical protein